MLEKTAASLEPCGFYRVVPGAAQSFRSTRQLRTTFWRHGAADLELTTAWQSLMHGTSDPVIGESAEENNDSALGASAFLLDFLYPTGAATLLRQLTSVTPARGRSNGFPYGQNSSKLGTRLYTPSLSRRQDRQPKTEATSEQGPRDQDDNPLADQAGGEHVDQSQTAGMVQTPDQRSDSESYKKPIQSNSDVAELTDTTRSDDHGHDHTEALEKLLDTDDPESADSIWNHYKALDASSQPAYMERVLLSLSKRKRLTDLWKISELFHQIPSSAWTDEIFVAGVAAERNLQNADVALKVFVEGLGLERLDNTSLVDALDLLLSSALRSSTATSLKELWAHYPAMAQRWDFEGITSQLTDVAAVPGLVDKALEFESCGRPALVEPDGTGPSQEAIDTLQRLLVRRALTSCAMSHVIPLLNVSKDHLAFEEFLQSVSFPGGVIPEEKRRLGMAVYRLYRDLPESQPSHAALHSVFYASRSLRLPSSEMHAIAELLWKDWHTFHTNPSSSAFRSYMTFYASEGETDKVYDMWKEWIKLYSDDPEQNLLEAGDTFTYLLQVHAVRGEAQEVQRIFNFVAQKFHLEPNGVHWNILLNAYAKARDYEAVVSTFDKVLSVGMADSVSYGTMMQMAADRGDLAFTIELYQQALSSGVRVDQAILCSLVEAYCQNDYFGAAEDMCVRASKKGFATIRSWNILLHHHALRRDLAAMNQILVSMADLNIPYDPNTYVQLLTGLSLCRQSHHALALLTTALKDKIFKVTHDHFHIVMGALIRTGEPAVVQRLHKLMQDCGFSSTSESLFKLVQSLSQWRQLPPEQRSRHTPKEWLHQTLHAFADIYGLNDADAALQEVPDNRSRPGKLLEKKTENVHFSAMIFMFTEGRDFYGARQLIDLYRHTFRSRGKSNEALPISMLTSVMRMDMHEKQYDQVKMSWDVLVELARKEGQSVNRQSEAPEISPRYRYILSPGLEVMQEVLLAERDVIGLQRLFRQVRLAGFEIDSKNWNHHIQALATLGEHRAAFVWCEKVLMPNWMGWNVARQRQNVKNQIPLELRQKGNNPRHLRPVTKTLYHLVRSYIELGEQSSFSPEAASTAEKIEQQCPQVMRAIKSMQRVQTNFEYDIYDRVEF
ncbi:hypothetical protein GGR52DRAFT_151114 [Hypoxylon sp. FL1284]|nr:hypothetical protein GGR52DRAFT_151114 [Hypoxylon sp. FL1284]